MHAPRLQPDTTSKQLLFSTVRVDTQLEDGSEGAGTAFVFCTTHKGKTHSFIVTNRHVIEGAVRGSLVFTCSNQGKPVVGRGFKLDIQDFARAWFLPEDKSLDLAITPLPPLLRHIEQHHFQVYYHAIDAALIPDTASSQSFDALESVLFVGYPNGVWDKENLMPILRRGTTATPISLDFEGREEFLIDAAVYPGSSGSPVFLYEKQSHQHQETLYFIGIISSVFYKEDETRITSAPAPLQGGVSMLYSEMIDLGLVIKSSTVNSLATAFLEQAGF